MPEGIISMIGSSGQDTKSFKERLNNQQREVDPNTGFTRKIGFRLPIINVDAKFTPFQAPAREMQILEQQAWFAKVCWMAFGVSADDMGFTENSNKAVSESMEKRYAKGAVKPYLMLIQERINRELMHEFEADELKFEFDFYDLEEDNTRHDLFAKQINMGIKTPEMIAEAEGIDTVMLKQQKEEADAKEVEKGNAMNQGFEANDGGFGKSPKKDDTKKPDMKALTLAPGVKVRCTTPIEGYTGKIGIIEEELEDGSFIVRYDNNSITLGREEIVVAGNDTRGLDLINGDDPFDNTLLEEELVKEIENASKKIKVALKIYGKGALEDGK